MSEMPQFRKIDHLEELPPGTEVNIKGNRHVVVSSSMKRDQHQKPIRVHMVRKTHQGRRPIDRVTKEFGCNYSFIFVKIELDK